MNDFKLMLTTYRLLGIKGYVENNGSQAQAFHLRASIIGAVSYAESIGINKYDFI